MRGHFGHVTKMAVTPFDMTYLKTPCYAQTSYLHVLSKRSYGRSKFYIEGIRIFGHFCSCDLDFDPMTFIYYLDPYSL